MFNYGYRVDCALTEAVTPGAVTVGHEYKRTSEIIARAETIQNECRTMKEMLHNDFASKRFFLFCVYDNENEKQKRSWN